VSRERVSRERGNKRVLTCASTSLRWERTNVRSPNVWLAKQGVRVVTKQSGQN